jgi:hypothetical protein
MLMGSTVAIAKITTNAMMETISGDTVTPTMSAGEASPLCQ